METHDEMDKARPEKEISSDFNTGPVTQGIGAQRSSDVSAQNNEKGVSSKVPTAGLWHRKESNPYRLTQTSEKGVQNQPLKEESFESSAHSGFMQKIKAKLFSQESGEGNAKQKAMIVLVPILAIVFIFVLRQVFTKSPTKTDATTNDSMSAEITTDILSFVFTKSPTKTDATTNDSMSVVISADNSNDDIDWQIPEPLPVVMRDPAKTGSQATSNNSQQNSDETQLGDMTVRGILYSYDKPSVVIGGKIVHLNEKINDVTIVDIYKDYVVLEKDGKRWTKRVTESHLNQDYLFQKEIDYEEKEQSLDGEQNSSSES